MTVAPLCRNEYSLNRPAVAALEQPRLVPLFARLVAERENAVADRTLNQSKPQAALMELLLVKYRCIVTKSLPLIYSEKIIT
jgi:hypothetical protein